MADTLETVSRRGRVLFDSAAVMELQAIMSEFDGEPVRSADRDSSGD